MMLSDNVQLRLTGVEVEHCNLERAERRNRYKTVGLRISPHLPRLHPRIHQTTEKKN